MSQKNRFIASYSPPHTRDQIQGELKTPLASATNQGSPARSEIVQESPHRDPLPLIALRPARVSSLNLYSIISRFEALDAVSLPPRIPPNQLAPLQVPRNSMRGRGDKGAAGQLWKLSTIFSPGIKTPVNRKIRNGTQDNLHPEQEQGATSDSEHTVTMKKLTYRKGSWRNRPRKGLSLRKSRTSMLVSGTGRSRSGSPVKTGQGAWNKDRIAAENGPKLTRGKSIKDMIQFYDGAVPSPRSTRAKPSLSSPQGPRTPAAQGSTDENKEQIRTSRRSMPRQEKGYIRDEAPRTPSIRRVNGMSFTIAQETLSVQTPMSKSSVSACGIYQLSPTKSQFGSASNKISPRRSLRASMFNTPDGGAIIDKTLAFSPSILSSHGRAPASIAESGKRMSSSRAKVCSQIEALYRAKSLERRGETSHENHTDQFPITPTKLQRETTSEKVMSTPVRRRPKFPADVSPSRVGEMKKLFEKQALNVPETPQSNKSPLKRSIEPANSIEREGTVKQSQPSSAQPPPSSPPPPPPLPSFSNRTSGISPKTLRETLLRTPVPVPATLKPVEPIIAPPIKTKPAETKAQQMKSRLLVEKIRLFEDIAERKTRIESRRKRRSISNKITIPSLKSRKSLFELTTRKSTKSLSKSQSSETIQAISKDSQRGALSTRFGKRTSQRGTSYNLPQDAASDFSNASYLTARDDTQILLESTSASLEMVVKEAQCGLREPKPMRLVEMKRMMLLCRDKAGFSSISLGRRKINVSNGGFGRIEDA